MPIIWVVPDHIWIEVVHTISSPCKTVGGSFKVEGARVKEGASGGCLGRLTCLGALRLLCLACSYPSFAPTQKLCSDCPAAT